VSGEDPEIPNRKFLQDGTMNPADNLPTGRQKDWTMAKVERLLGETPFQVNGTFRIDL